MAARFVANCVGLVLCGFTAALCGCISPPQRVAAPNALPRALQDDPGRIAVVARSTPPALWVHGLTLYANSFTALSRCLDNAAEGRGGTPAVMIPAAVWGAMAAVACTREGLEEERRQQNQRKFAANIAHVVSARRNTALRDEVAALLAKRFPDRYVEVPDPRLLVIQADSGYQDLAKAGIENVLEVGLWAISTSAVNRPANEEDPLVTVEIGAQARLIRARDRVSLFSGVFWYQGERRKQSQWQRSPKDLDQAVTNLYATIAPQVFEELFLLYPFPDRTPAGPQGALPADAAFATFGLAPTEIRESLRPVLEWEGFPRRVDVEAIPRDMAEVRNVTYDLVVREGQRAGLHYVPGPVIYRREKLRGNRHELEEPLRHNSVYFWSVRARFELDGRVRVTEWSRSYTGRWELPETPYELATPLDAMYR